MDNKQFVVSESEREFIKAEYEALFGLTISIEDRILTVFTGTVAVSVTLLSAVCGYVFKSEHIGAGDAYIALAPLLLLLPSFLLLLNLRKDMARIAAYQLVFVEERQLGPTWGTSLLVFRQQSPSSESLDTVPFAYWSLSGACSAAFVYVLHRTQVPLGEHSVVLVGVALVLVWLTTHWNAAILQIPGYAERWRCIRDRNQNVEPSSSTWKVRGQEMDKNAMDLHRYSLLGQIWGQHNQSQLQWPVVAAGVVLVGLGTLVTTGGVDAIKAISSWGRLRSPVLGVFFLLAAMMTSLMVRTMKRARKIMALLERELDTYDAALEFSIERRFSGLNHARTNSGQREFSGPLLLAAALILMVILSGALGLFLVVGRRYGIILTVVLVGWSLWQALLVFKTYSIGPLPIVEESKNAAGSGQQ